MAEEEEEEEDGDGDGDEGEEEEEETDVRGRGSTIVQKTKYVSVVVLTVLQLEMAQKWERQNNVLQNTGIKMDRERRYHTDEHLTCGL